MSCIEGVKGPQSQVEITKMEAFLRTQTTLYFVRTGNPRYLGGKTQDIIFSQNLPNMGGEIAQF